jgi:hypothetical protein
MRLAQEYVNQFVKGNFSYRYNLATDSGDA